MSRSIALGAALIAGVVVAAADLPHPVDWLQNPADRDTLAAARLSPAGRRDLLRQIEATSFDAPDSWTSELRVRRIALGAADGLAVRGTRLLCGGTGNCETWLFRRAGGRWQSLFEGEAPLASRIGFVRGGAAVADLVMTTHTSAERETWIRYRFDGRFYRPAECYDVDAGAPDKASRISCR